MNKALIFVFFVTVTPILSQVGPRSWEDHRSISSCNTVTKLGSDIYASYYNGIIKFNEKELSPKTINKINGLSDVGVRLLRTNSYNNKVLVIYDNCNIDVIDEKGNISNYPSVKLKTLNGKKIVNEVTFSKQFAYLSCGFGIVVFDTDKLEIKDTYIIGPNGDELEIYQVALNDSIIFAATPTGLYRSNHKTKVLNNYQNWKRESGVLPLGPYAGVVASSGTILALYAPSKADQFFRNHDTIYSYFNNAWQKFPPMANEPQTILKFGPVFEDQFSLIQSVPSSLIVKGLPSGSITAVINSFNGQVEYGTMNDACIGKDQTGNISYWLADSRFGLYQCYNGYPYGIQTNVTRNGTHGNRTAKIDVFEGKVAVAPSLIDNAGAGNYLTEGINVLKDKEWTYIPCNEPNGNVIMDVTSVLFDRNDRTLMWACSWSYGVMKYKDNKLVATYTPSNSAMSSHPLTNEARCSGLSMDKDGNLWFAQSDQKGYLSVLKKTGQIQNFEFDAGHFTRKTFIDRNNYIWMLHERDEGITVFKPTNFNTPQPGVNYKSISNQVGKGNLQSTSVYAIAEDHDGKIWIGTSHGISVFYNPTAIFSGGDYDSQPIKIVQDGNVELLLDKETVTSIVVDGANNKWVGTLQGGVYCFSPDGITQIYHFTKENSPLYSNTVNDVNYDKTTGDLFFGTEVGIQSFRSIIIAGDEQYTNVFAYPNPVRPGYQGTVLVRGLVDESIIKITDESGNLVWETKSTGGQIEWPVKTLNGSRVTSGVYVVYASTTDGELKTLTKVLVVN
jgi:hypothetical protein